MNDELRIKNRGNIFFNYLFPISYSCQAGFTLMEILLVMALLVIVASFSLPIFTAVQSRSDLDNTAIMIAQTLRRAQILTQAVDGDTTWGVYLAAGSLTLFKGSSFASRETNYDEVFDLATNITPSDLTEIVYSKFYGLPQVTGAITLTSINNNIKTLNLNAKGAVDY